MVILSRVFSEHITEVRLLECGDDFNPPRNNILQSLVNPYYRLQEQRFAVGRKALHAAWGSVTATCQLCRRPGHIADQCPSYQITKARNAKAEGRRAEEGIRNEAPDKERTGYQGITTKSRCCYVCEETGHIPRNCPRRKNKAENTGK